MQNDRLEDSLIVQLIPKLKLAYQENQDTLYPKLENQKAQLTLDSSYLELVPICKLNSITQLNEVLDLSPLKPLQDKNSLQFKAHPFQMSRTLLDSFLEEEYLIDYQIPSADTSDLEQKSISIQILSENDKIIFLSIRERSDTEPLLYRKCSLERVEAFIQTYMQAYHIDISLSDLFESSVVYGSDCGLAAMDPAYRVILNKAIEQQDTSLLNLWLRLPSLEKQVYGYEGLLQLEKKGYLMSEEQKRLITLLKSRVGNIWSCSGCIYFHKSWQEVFEFEVGE